MPEFKQKKLLTVPVLKFIQDQTRYVKVTEKMHEGKPQPPDKEGKTKAPATICEAVNLEDGTQCLLVVPAIVKGVFTDNYPDDGYVGKCFAITKRGRNPAKQYNQFDVAEVEDPAETAEAAPVRHVGRR